MTLPKHLRPRWRYLAVAFTTWPDVQLSRHSVQQAMTQSTRDLLGDTGDARTELRLVSFVNADGIAEGIIRTHRETVEEARAAITCIRTVDDEPVGVYIRGISGTVRACEEKYLGRGTEPFPEKTVVFDGAERPAVVRGADIDVRVDEAYIGATRLDLE